MRGRCGVAGLLCGRVERPFQGSAISPLLDDYVAPIVDPLFRVPRREDEAAEPTEEPPQDD